MSSTKGLYDAPRVLERVMREFEIRHLRAAEVLKWPDHKEYGYAAALWEGFKSGYEFAITEELEHLRKIVKGEDEPCGT